MGRRARPAVRLPEPAPVPPPHPGVHRYRFANDSRQTVSACKDVDGAAISGSPLCRQIASETYGYLVARYVIGARIGALHGDRFAAVERLEAGMQAAQRLRVPRRAAAVNNERIRLGIQIAPVVAARLRSTRTIPHNIGIATLTAELDEDSAVRLLAASDSPDDQRQACTRAADLATGIDGQRRPLAARQAELLLVETLTATGRVAEARAGASRVSARCGELGLPRLLVDAGLG